MGETTLGTAFALYSSAATNFRVLTDDESEAFVSLITNFVEYCVRAGLHPVDSDFPDFTNECLLRVWEAASRRVLPFDDIRRFVEGIKTICRNRCTDLHRSRARRTALAGNLATVFKNELWPMAPDGEASSRELLAAPVELVTAGMVERNRWLEVTEDLCRDAAGILLVGRPRAKISMNLRKCVRKQGLFRHDFFVPYLTVLYRWSFYDLRTEVLAMLDKLRPAG